MPNRAGASGSPTLAEYLQSAGITCEPCRPDAGDHPPVSIPELPGWESAPSDVIPNAYQVLVNPLHTEQDWTPNAVLLHGRLSGQVDVEALLDCGPADSRELPDWQEYATSREPHRGHPSAFVQGLYVVNGIAFAATNRYVITTFGESQFLTQLTVTIIQSQTDDLDVDVVVLNSALDIAAA